MSLVLQSTYCTLLFHQCAYILLCFFLHNLSEYKTFVLPHYYSCLFQALVLDVVCNLQHFNSLVDSPEFNFLLLYHCKYLFSILCCQLYFVYVTFILSTVCNVLFGCNPISTYFQGEIALIRLDRTTFLLFTMLKTILYCPVPLTACSLLGIFTTIKVQLTPLMKYCLWQTCNSVLLRFFIVFCCFCFSLC